MTDTVLTAEAAAAAVRAGRISARELVAQALAAIAATGEQLNSFVYVDAERAMETAADVDRALAAGKPAGPLAGVPFGVKDIDDARGMPTVRGSRWFASAPPAPADDLHVARLRAAGAIPVGKTATPELAFSAFTASLVSGVTRNPWDPARTPGGSSGGSAAAVAAGLVPFCTAGDGGGSIRTPAAFSGLPGLRPAYGRVPTLGVTHVAQNAVAFALAATVADTALLLDICAGPDRRDRTCLPPPARSYRAAIDSFPTEGLRAALSPDLGFLPVEAEVADIVASAYRELVTAAGLTAVAAPVKLDPFHDIYLKIEGVDRFVDLPGGLWPERAGELSPAMEAVMRSGARATLPRIGAVYTARARFERQVAALFDDIDILVTPTVSYPAFAAEGPYPAEIAGQAAAPYAGVAFAFVASICNLPAISVPAGVTAAGLPVGMQIIAAQHSEHVCLRLARLLEAARPWPRHAPGWPGPRLP